MARPQPPAPDWLRPLWVRVAVVAIPVVWATGEAWYGHTEWVVIVAAAAAYGAWTMLIKFERDSEKGDLPPE